MTYYALDLEYISVETTIVGGYNIGRRRKNPEEKQK
jgi:hypothetical protein